MNKKLNIITASLGIIVFCVIIYFSQSNYNQLKQNGVLISVKITNFVIGGRGAGGFRCSFLYNGKRITSFSRTSIYKSRAFFVGKHFPALYLPKTTSSINLLLLITPSDFKEVGLPFPDSLLWVKEFIDNKK